MKVAKHDAGTEVAKFAKVYLAIVRDPDAHIVVATRQQAEDWLDQKGQAPHVIEEWGIADVQVVMDYEP